MRKRNKRLAVGQGPIIKDTQEWLRTFNANDDEKKLYADSITNVINQIRQPYGGLIKTKWFNEVDLSNELDLQDGEKGESSLIGISVDYLTRFKINHNAEDAFQISLEGASRVNDPDYSILTNDQLIEDDIRRSTMEPEEYSAWQIEKTDIMKDKLSIVQHNLNGDTNHLQHAKRLVQNIQNGIDVIKSAYELAQYDSVIRNDLYLPIDKDSINDVAIRNVDMMSDWCVDQLSSAKDLTSHLIFPQGYGNIIQSGDADFKSDDTIFDIKVTKANSIKSETKLALIVYYVLGMRSIYRSEYSKIDRFTVINPRLGKLYTLHIEDVDQSIIEWIIRIIGK